MHLCEPNEDSFIRLLSINGLFFLNVFHTYTWENDIICLKEPAESTRILLVQSIFNLHVEE